MVTGHVKTQLIAHDKEVYDIAFSKAGGGRDMFASVGADGSVRMFDLRHLEHSTIIYEDPHHTPLLRLAWNKQDTNYLATVAMDACEVIILDIRVPCTPVARLNNHRACGGVGVVEGALGGELGGVLVQGDHLDLVVVLLHKTAQCKSEPSVWSN